MVGIKRLVAIAAAAAVSLWTIEECRAISKGEGLVLMALFTYAVTWTLIGLIAAALESGLRRMRPTNSLPFVLPVLGGLMALIWLAMSTLGVNLPLVPGKINLLYGILCAGLGAIGFLLRDRETQRRFAPVLLAASFALMLAWAWIFPERQGAATPYSYLASAAALCTLFASAIAALRASEVRIAPLAVPIIVLMIAAPVLDFVARGSRSPQRVLERYSASDRGTPREGAGERANVILIIWDTVRRDHLSLYGYERETTPYLDRFSKDARVYTQAISVAPWTLPAHVSMFTGLYPHEHGVHGLGRGANKDEHMAMHHVPKDLPILAEILRDDGFATAAVSANTAFVSRLTNIERGFETFVDRENPNFLQYDFTLHNVLLAAWLPSLPSWFSNAYGLPFPHADQVTRIGLEWLDSRTDERPFFLFLNYMDVHEPRYPPPDLAEHFPGDVSPVSGYELYDRDYVAAYDATILHLDRSFASLVGSLEARGVLENSLIVLTSDHGEFMGDHGLVGHGLHIYGGNIDIPLVVRFPGAQHAGQDPRPIEIREIFSLVMQTLSGSTAPTITSPVYAEHYGTDTRPTRRAVIFDSHKLISDDQGAVELYATTKDPLEQTNLADENAALTERGLNLLSDFYTPEEAESESVSSEHLKSLTPEAESRLRALGYIE